LIKGGEGLKHPGGRRDIRGAGGHMYPKTEIAARTFRGTEGIKKGGGKKGKFKSTCDGDYR